MMKYIYLTIITLFIGLLSFGQDSITIASWNLKNFGQTKLNDASRINVIVDVIKEFDIVAIQEVQDISLQLPDKLIELINQDGSNYKQISSNRVGRIRKEQYVYVYNVDKVALISSTIGYGLECNDEFAREPFYCGFKAGNFDFILFTIHTDPDDVNIEVPALANAYLHLQNNTKIENDIIMLGDFNANAPNSQFEGYIEMSSIDEISNIFFCIEDETNTAGGKSYDNIIFQSNYTSEYSNSSGVYIFWQIHNISLELGKKISDHLPVWASFKISGNDDDFE